MARLVIVLALASWLIPLGGFQTHAQDAAKPPASASQLPADVTTSHVLHIGGAERAYDVTAGSLPLQDAKGERKADLFYVAYRLQGTQSASRPLSFVFNGGPGAASAYLHLGALGPQVLDFGPTPDNFAATTRLIENPDSWLDITDLVFIDPVGTGYSRGIGSDDEIAKQFWGVRQDVEAMAAFIRLYTTRAGRTGSPKYLVGESYGGFRAARLLHALQMDQGLAPIGAFMISPVLEFGTIRSDRYTPLSWALRLPSYAATVLASEDRLTPEALAPVEQFALGDYLTGLASGPRDPAVAQRLYDAVARFTTLPRDLVVQQNGRIPTSLFIKQIRHGDGHLVSRYDATFAAIDPFPASLEPRGGDPILQGSIAPFTTAFLDYARNQLNYVTDLRYVLLSDVVGRHWDWGGGGQGGQGYAGSLDELREALALNPKQHVVIAHGMTDLVTPYLGTRYLIDQLPNLGDQPRVTLKLYQGGHMMYLRAGSRAQLHRDALAFYAAKSN